MLPKYGQRCNNGSDERGSKLTHEDHKTARNTCREERIADSAAHHASDVGERSLLHCRCSGFDGRADAGDGRIVGCQEEL